MFFNALIILRSGAAVNVLCQNTQYGFCQSCGQQNANCALAGGSPSGLSQATRIGFAVRESCALPLTHLPAKTENTARVFRFVCDRLVALAANHIASNSRTQRREICCQQISYQGKFPLTPRSANIAVKSDRKIQWNNEVGTVLLDETPLVFFYRNIFEMGVSVEVIPKCFAVVGVITQNIA